MNSWQIASTAWLRAIFFSAFFHTVALAAPLAPTETLTPAATSKGRLGDASEDSDSPWQATALFEVPGLEIGFRPPSGKGKETLYRPNSNLHVGGGLKYKGFGANINLPLPQTTASVRSQGQTDHFDLILDYQWEQGGFEIFYQSYRGFFVSDPGPIGKNPDGELNYTKRPDLTARNIGATYFWAFTPNAYGIKPRSLRPYAGRSHSGSWLLFSSINRYRLASEQSLFESKTGDRALDQLRAGDFTSLSVGGGYGHGFRNHAHVTDFHLLLGAGGQLQETEYLDSNANESRVAPVIKLGLRLEYGYLLSGWSFGGRLVADYVKTDIGGDAELQTTLTSFIIQAKTEI